MPPTRETHKHIDRLRRGAPSVTLPGTQAKINLPDGPSLFWYAGIGTMAVLELVEWPVALIIVGTHFIENHAHNRDVQELAEGIDSGA